MFLQMSMNVRARMEAVTITAQTSLEAMSVPVSVDMPYKPMEVV